ncbi:MAG: deoxyribose-phosphate aldolase [Opitutales bacterium]|nr:deoxyribose-phosphate aldolase [Opitutales bacterium]MCH8539344.1 deoxyribose-phosphate aldolase [Opitutales bacterium]
MEKSLADYLDAAVLAPEMKESEAKEAILHCIEHKTRTVCVRPCDLPLAVQLCQGTATEPIVVVAFPHGANTPDTKAAEARDTIQNGAREVDMVANIGRIRSGNWDAVRQDIEAVAKETKAAKVPLKVILETAFLTVEEIHQATLCAIEAGADFVKTSTGFGPGGASEEAVRQMLETSAGRIKVKASGGIRTVEQAKAYVTMGVERLGVGFGSVEVLCGGKAKPKGEQTAY